MKNLRRSNISIEEGLRQAGLGLHIVKRTFFNMYQETFRQCFSEYDRYAQNGNLNILRPIWEDALDDTPEEKSEKEYNRELAKRIYDSHRPFINKHWDILKNQNGGRVLICPICGLNECNEMDHYIPSSVMQEYSFHLTNLIPLCHSCNHKKSDKWLDNDGRREIFNAYFDEEYPEPIIACSIRLSEIDGQPEICVNINQSLQPDNPSHKIILSTIDKLHLLYEYRSILRNVFSDELVRINSSYRQQSDRKTIHEIWDEQKNIYHLMLAQPDRLTLPTLCIITAIVNSEVMDEWAKNISY